MPVPFLLHARRLAMNVEELVRIVILILQIMYELLKGAQQ